MSKQYRGIFERSRCRREGEEEPGTRAKIGTY